MNLVDNLIALLRQRCFRPLNNELRGENDIAVRYIMDGNEKYLYPNVLFAASLFRPSSQEVSALYPQRANEYSNVEQLATLSLTSLYALGKMARDMRRQLEAAKQRGDKNTVDQIQQSILEAQTILVRSTDRFPHLTSLLPSLQGQIVPSSLPPMMPAMQKTSDGQYFMDVHYADMWRDNLLSHIQSMCAYMGNYEIVKGTGMLRSKVRRNFESIEHWRDTCHRRDQFYNLPEQDAAYLSSEQVIDDIEENVHVFSGQGRLVRRKLTKKDYSADDVNQISKLFMAFPGCFLYKVFPLTTQQRSIPTYQGRLSKDTVFVTLQKQLLIARTNQVLPPGIYRLDRTIFLTLREDHSRTIAVRSDYREANNTLRFAEKHYSQPNFDDPDAIPLKIYHAGNANMFMALQKNSDRHLLGFWIGCMSKNANIGEREYAIEYNSRVGLLPDCQIRHSGGSREFIQIIAGPEDVIYKNRQMPPHDVVRLVVVSAPKYGSVAYDELRNGLLVDFLCASQPGERCPASLPQEPAKFKGVAGVGLFLFYYALVYYSKYSPSSLNLFVRRWVSRPLSKKKKKDNQFIFAEATIAEYYHSNFGLQFVPNKSALAKGNHLHTTKDVQKEIEKEFGLDYMRSEYPEAFSRPFPLKELLEKYPEFCHFAILLRNEMNVDGTVDLNQLGKSSLFKSSFHWPADKTMELENEKEDVVSIGRMFRYYPHLAELEMRIVEAFLSFINRLEKRKELDSKIAQSLLYRYQGTLVPDNNSLEHFAQTVEQHAKTEYLRKNNNDVAGWEDDKNKEVAALLRAKHANKMIAAERFRYPNISWDESIDELEQSN